MKTRRVYVTPDQFRAICALADTWDGNSRWLPALDTYLWDQGIQVLPESTPTEPSSYCFLAGGIDHIDQAENSVTFFDRCLQRGNGVLDGTTTFRARRVRK